MGENAAQALRRSTREPEAFAIFYTEHFETILAYLARRLFDAESALDLTAETFAQAYLSRRRFRGTTKEEAEAWLYRIASRQLSRYFRRKKLERRAMRRLGIETPHVDDERRARIEELAELAGLRTTVRSELARLSSAQREALRLRVVEELSYAEIAGRLEISEQAARARVARGLKALAAALDRTPLLVDKPT